MTQGQNKLTTHPHVRQYHEELERLIRSGGSGNESSTRRAFENCLDSYCREHRDRLVLVAELPTVNGVIPDGTVKDSLRMARGYWEAKDSGDDLDAEIQRKLNSGYPRDNIIFENTLTAVLVQNGETAMQVDMSRVGELHRLIRRFLDYELPQLEEFRQAQRQFKADLPAVLDNLRQSVDDAARNNSQYQAAADDFLNLCRQSISPAISPADVREMLLQHVLTKDIFLRVFAEDQFHRENNVARRLDALEGAFFTGDIRRQAIDRLRAYYGVIGRAASEIADHAEKQQFLKAIYEDFYKAYNPAAADRLGVVYTPNEVVDFMIRGADYLLHKHFGRRLADDNVQILDPATGTGTFITSLIDHLPEDRLEYKYLNEVHANEVAILPYYIANLNIEYTYKERTGRYLEFPNLVFVDTLDNMDWQQKGATGGAVQRQSALELGRLEHRELGAYAGAERKDHQRHHRQPALITPISRTKTTTTRTANTQRWTAASKKAMSLRVQHGRRNSMICTSALYAGHQTGWPTTELSLSSPTGHILIRDRTTASERLPPRSLATYMSSTWVRTCAATQRFLGQPTTSLAYRPASPLAFSCGGKLNVVKETSTTPDARTPSLPGIS